MMLQRNPVPIVLHQHVEDAAALYNNRAWLLRAPNCKLHQLGRCEDRLAAHLDGIGVGGDSALAICQAALESPGPASIFIPAVRAIEDKRPGELRQLFALAMAIPDSQAGLRAAFGWVNAPALRDIVKSMLDASEPTIRAAAIAASSMHRVDPNLNSARRFEDPDAMVRARAWRAAGELGKNEMVSTAAAAAIGDEDPACQFWAAWSAVLLGDRQNALELLKRIATEVGPFRARAFQLATQATDVPSGHAFLRPLAQDPANTRRVIRGAGSLGDPTYIPWLIGFMANDALARLAGESFSLITGLDLAWLDLERKPPENFESGPNDDPNDPNVEMDEDDGLPWPDQNLVQAWWNANSHRFQTGVRYFMGEPLNRENCVRVLKEGFQRQRIAAAYHLCLLNPGTPLFEWRAPAWRQQRELEQMKGTAG